MKLLPPQPRPLLVRTRSGIAAPAGRLPPAPAPTFSIRPRRSPSSCMRSLRTRASPPGPVPSAWSDTGLACMHSFIHPFTHSMSAGNTPAAHLQLPSLVGGETAWGEVKEHWEIKVFVESPRKGKDGVPAWVMLRGGAWLLQQGGQQRPVWAVDQAGLPRARGAPTTCLALLSVRFCPRLLHPREHPRPFCKSGNRAKAAARRPSVLGEANTRARRSRSAGHFGVAAGLSLVFPSKPPHPTMSQVKRPCPLWCPQQG